MHNKKADVPLKGHERKGACQVHVYISRVFIREGGKTENVGFGVFVRFDDGSACHWAVKTKAIVGVDVVEGNQLDIFVSGRLDQRDLEEFVGHPGCKDVAHTLNSLVCLLHMAFRSGWAWVEILGYPMGC
jgi:hypothetical protein